MKYLYLFFLLVFQKSLWDTIKNKREGEKVVVPRRKKTEPPLKMAANKTFQVSRKQQYKRDKPRSPFALLNDGKADRERSLTKQECMVLNPNERQQSLAESEQENIPHAHKNSPLFLLVSPTKIMDSGNVSASTDVLAARPENKELFKVLNRTLSPIGTPERFKKLMPHIQSESPVFTAVKSVDDDADSVLTKSPVLSLKDALAIISSDLIKSSPQDTSSSCDFSDSLESKSGIDDRNALKPLPDSPELSESNEPRLTFFVSKKVIVSEVVSETESENAVARVKKAFTSATVTKGKAPAEANSSSGRKIKKSRRRLLEKTLELSDGSSQCESGPGTPNLPVIDVDEGANGWQDCEASSSLCDDRHRVLEFTSSSPTPQLSDSPAPIAFPVTSPVSTAPTTFFFSCTSPPPAVTDASALNLLPSSHPSSPLHLNLSSKHNAHEWAPAVPAPLSVQEDLFPIHMAVNGKKRKSEEYLKRDVKPEDAGKTDRVKRSRVVAVKTEPTRSVQERRSLSQRQPLRAAGVHMF